MASAPALSRNMEGAKTRHDLFPGLGACNIGTICKFTDRLNDSVPIDPRLSRAKILSGPFEEVRNVEPCGSARTNAPSPLGHENLFDCSGNDLLREVIQIGLQLLDRPEFFDFASIQCADADASRCP